MRFVRWSENLGKPECPYIRRWVFDFGLFSIRIHHWIGSDDPRHFHDHPWWYWTFIVAGVYVDRSPNGDEIMMPGTLRFRPAEHRHTVKVLTKGCWSILLAGPEKRVWGFWVNGKFRKRNKYFFEHGEHPCQ